MGRSCSVLDMILTATDEANVCILVTDNEKLFAGLKFINPMRRGLMSRAFPSFRVGTRRTRR